MGTGPKRVTGTCALDSYAGFGIVFIMPLNNTCVA